MVRTCAQKGRRSAAGPPAPQSDKDIVEALLYAALKDSKAKEEQIRSAKDNSPEGQTPLDIAKERREILLAQCGNSEAGEAAGAKIKAKYDKIIEWLSKGLPVQG